MAAKLKISTATLYKYMNGDMIPGGQILWRACVHLPIVLDKDGLHPPRRGRSPNTVGKPLDLDACYRREMKDILKKAAIGWHGWHGFRRGLASNLNRLGVDDSVIQRILRHCTVVTTQNHYIKTASPDAIAAMKQFSEALLCSTGAPDEPCDTKATVQ